MLSRKDELHTFKTQINLCEYAASTGFEFDVKSSSRHSAVMRHSNGEKVVIARNSSQEWIYFNVHQTAKDSGTIIDFVQVRKGFSLGEVRKELRPWVGKGAMSAACHEPKPHFRLVPSSHNASAVAANWIAAKQVSVPQRYLTEDRRLPSSVLADPIFGDRLRTDQRSNILFPHWNQYGSLCGYEVKNRGFTGFAPGGTKGLWCSRPRPDDQVMVLAETAIDALSVAAIFGPDRKRFFSTAGQISPSQAACIRSAVSRMPADAEIWLAFDNDDGGLKLAKQVKDALATLTGNTRKVIMSLPPNFGEDWNDVLRRNAKPPLPRFHNE